MVQRPAAVAKSGHSWQPERQADSWEE